MKLKKIFCWPPLLGGIGAGVTIGILAYISFQAILAGTIYGLWLAASFGSSVVVVFGYPDNEFAQPKNVLLGHLLCAFVGFIIVTLFTILLPFILIQVYLLLLLAYIRFSLLFVFGLIFR